MKHDVPRTTLISCVCALASLLTPGLAAAQDPAAPPSAAPWRQRFEVLSANTLKIREQTFKDVEADVRRRHAFPSAALQTPALSGASGITAVELATAALKTSIEGAEAGVSVAPLALAGLDKSPVQVNATFAALKELKTEFGVAAFFQSVWDPAELKDVHLAPCKFDDDAKKALIEALNNVSPALEESCRLMAALDKIDGIPHSPAREEATRICEAPVKCEGTSTGNANCDGVNGLIGAIKVAVRQVEGGKKKAPLPDWARTGAQAVDKAATALAKLDVFRKNYPRPNCFDADKLSDAMIRSKWQEPQYRAGVGVTFDLFPLMWGFNPDTTKKLAAGELSKLVIRAELARVTGPFELHLGFGVGRSRTEVDKSLYSYLTPSLSISGTVCGLSKGGLYEDAKPGEERQLRVVKGALPPRLALGLDAQLEYSITRPDTQVTALQALTVTAYADFRFTDTLGIRIGVPLAGKLVTREKDDKKTPVVTEKTDLQWSLPVFATTVIKL